MAPAQEVARQRDAESVFGVGLALVPPVSEHAALEETKFQKTQFPEVPAPGVPRLRALETPSAASSSRGLGSKSPPPAPAFPQPASSPSEAETLARIAPPLREAYRAYLSGRRAYDAGDREGAKRDFLEAYRLSPQGSPLKAFLERVLKPRAQAPRAPAPGGPGNLEAPGKLAPNPPSPRPPLGTSARSPVGKIIRPDQPRTTPLTRGAQARGARQKARNLWFQGLKAEGPHRPSMILDAAAPGREAEWIATGLLVVSILGFLGLWWI